MCGIAGVAAFDVRRPLDPAALAPMLACIAHRGPDDEGTYAAPGVVLGHRRLSVIDVAGGHQPLFGARPSTAVICNGEIYNYRALAAELSALGHRFVTRSDTEVVAHAYDRWGLDFLDRLEGMFALALWDGAAGRLVLARDRMGEKPLYHSVADGLLIFASELTALRAHSAVNSELDLRSLAYYLALEYVPAPNSILRGVHKLEPGHALVLERGRIESFAYWQIPLGPRSRIPFRQAARELRLRLDDAVHAQLVSDVPLGIFLSGGIDSSTIAALAARHGALDTFSIGFTEKSFDESAHANLVARHIGSRHHERLLRPTEMPELVPQLPRILDEPLGDASIVPTALLSRFAREHVTVALGGDGGDELFAGYPMHQAHRVAALARLLPNVAHHAIERSVRALPVSHRNFSLGFKLLSFLRGAAEKPPRNHGFWMSSFAGAEQHALLSPDVLAELGGAFDEFEPLERVWRESKAAPLLARATHLDAATYLPNDILMKVDRASMQVALEVRAPFLARSVVEFAFRQPDAYRMRGLTGKRLLRAAVADLVPRSILRRPKKGFGIPVAAWLNGPLRPLLHDMLDASALRAAGLFRADQVRRLVQQHAYGVADHRKPLWTLLVFELWRRHHLGAAVTEPLSAGVA
ncbi:MAG TPA: asparagine synthase (glutamine-hydrolyzing) [Longimicrobiales bacterium]|nr:asparagine synthase (glutamine-hydrolyzing) [Longimicrobiales bacterium]